MFFWNLLSFNSFLLDLILIVLWHFLFFLYLHRWILFLLVVSYSFPIRDFLFFLRNLFQLILLGYLSLILIGVFNKKASKSIRKVDFFIFNNFVKLHLLTKKLIMLFKKKRVHNTFISSSCSWIINKYNSEKLFYLRWYSVFNYGLLITIFWEELLQIKLFIFSVMLNLF